MDHIGAKDVNWVSQPRERGQLMRAIAHMWSTNAQATGKGLWARGQPSSWANILESAKTLRWK